MLTADYILKSTSIFTAADDTVRSGYIAIAKNQIVDVSETLNQNLVGESTEIMDLANRTVCPGFSDAHTFFTGWSMRYAGTDLSPASSAAEVINLAKSYAETLLPDKPVYGHGYAPSIPTGTPDELEEAFPNRPAILFNENAEQFWMNRTAINRYGFDNSADCNEVFWRLLEELLNDHAFSKPLFRQYMDMLNSRGITMTKEIGYDTFSSFTDVLKELEDSHQMTLRVNFMSQPVKEGANFSYGQNMREKFKNDFVRFSGYNRMTDGSISQRNGFLKQPYEGQPDLYCAQEIDWDTIHSEVLNADREGFRFSLNAQGDASVAKSVDIFSECAKDNNGKLQNRHAITEAEFSDPEDLKRMGDLGIICEFYPQIQSIADREGKTSMINEMIGKNRGANYWNRRKMADYGVPLCCGTDLPLVIDNIPESIYYTVTGNFPDSTVPFNKENTLTVSEVLTAWTRGGAYDMCREHDLGTIESGKLADLAVFDCDVFSTPAENMRSASICMTISDGKIVYNTL
jgi:predicted amidohydrolase YtcJ